MQFLTRTAIQLRNHHGPRLLSRQQISLRRDRSVEGPSAIQIHIFEKVEIIGSYRRTIDPGLSLGGVFRQASPDSEGRTSDHRGIQPNSLSILLTIQVESE